MYASGSTFIKKIKPFAGHYGSVIDKKQDCKTTCVIIGPPSVDLIFIDELGPFHQ